MAPENTGCDFATEDLGPRAIVDGVAGSQKPLGTPAIRDVRGFFAVAVGVCKPPLSQLANFWHSRLTGGLEFFSL